MSSQLEPPLGREAKIRTLAYEIWEREGYPEGKELDHWMQAEHELSVTDNASDAAANLTELQEVDEATPRSAQDR